MRTARCGRIDFGRAGWPLRRDLQRWPEWARRAFGCKPGRDRRRRCTLYQRALGMTTQDYIRDGAAIYARSFAIIRAEADLGRFSSEEERVAVRIIHACGMVEIVRDIIMSPTFASSASAALKSGAPILCDSMMVADGITRARLAAKNAVI